MVGKGAGAGGARFSIGLGPKVLAPVLLAWLVASVVLSAFFHWQVSRQGMADLELRLKSFVESKAAELSGPVWDFRDDMVNKLMQSYRFNEDLHSATLYDAEGGTVVAIGGTPRNYSRTLVRSARLVQYASGQLYELGRLEVEYHDGRVRQLLASRRRGGHLLHPGRAGLGHLAYASFHGGRPAAAAQGIVAAQYVRGQHGPPVVEQS